MPNPLDPMDGMWRTRRPRPTPRRPVPPHVWATVAAVIVAAVLAMGVLALTGTHPHPTPTPPVPPAPVGELRVLFVSDSGANVDRGQLDALYSTKVRDWLREHCGKDADGRPAWRSWDRTVEPKDEPEVWRKAWEATKPKLGKLPQVVIFHGQNGDTFPMPNTEDALLDLLAKHEGK